MIEILTICRKPARGQCQAGSLTGAVASKRVTEARKGFLSTDRNRARECKAEGSLTERLTSRPDTKVGLSDPAVVSGNAVAQRTKVTLGITGLSPPRVHIDGEVWHLDVGSSHPGAEVRSKVGCSPIKVVRELGSERRETVRSLSVAGEGYLRGVDLSTRGPG